MKTSIAGQYECLHRSGLELDYFTSRIDRLTIQGNGRFVLITQDRSRVANAAQSLLSGQQVSSVAPEVRREGTYIVQGGGIELRFDDGSQQQAQFVPNTTNLLVGQDTFTKTSDSTLLPSPERLKKDMEDIAKGLKIAGAIGGVAMKAAKTIHSTLQATQTATSPDTNTQTVSPPPSQTNQPQYSNNVGAPSYQPPPYTASSTYQQAQQPKAALYCDQCGAPVRAGKRFCNQCGARLD